MSRKMKLEDLKIESFVTTLSEEKQNHVKGGDEPITFNECRWDSWVECMTHH